MKWAGIVRNSPKSGYYMLPTTPAPGVHDHLSDREVSTVLFLPANTRSMVGELPQATQYLRTVHIHYHIRKYGVKS